MADLEGKIDIVVDVAALENLTMRVRDLESRIDLLNTRLDSVKLNLGVMTPRGPKPPDDCL
jgi:hypothetical protein